MKDKESSKLSALLRMMDLVFETYLLPSEAQDFPIVNSPIWIFGRSYSIQHGMKFLSSELISCASIHFELRCRPRGAQKNRCDMSVDQLSEKLS